MEGLVNGKCNKTKSRRGGKKTLDVKLISIWKLQFENQGLRLSKRLDSSLWALLQAILGIVLGNE
jgi:hypothetical protein